MSATLSYDLKKCMAVLAQDCRWNVLTVLILHSNIRNRCFVGMDTIAELAASGNKTKATRAKKWLQTHGAFEIVPFSKRVGDELSLPPRQHIYQLTGELKQCKEKTCPCQNWSERQFLYLYHGMLVPPAIENINVLPIENIEQNVIPPNVLPIENINVLPIEIINGENVSSTNRSKKEISESRARTPHDYDDVPKDDRLQIIRAWAEALSAPPIGAYKREANHSVAAEIFRAGYRAPQVALFVKSKRTDNFWRDKTLTLAKVAELMPEWLMNLKAAPTVPREVISRPDAVPQEWGVNQFVREAVTHE